MKNDLAFSIEDQEVIDLWDVSSVSHTEVSDGVSSIFEQQENAAVLASDAFTSPTPILSGKPTTQIMGDLPPERIQADVALFTFVGLDAFSPIDVAYRRSSLQKYVCLFTCLPTRAIHLKVLNGLDADSFANASRCFISRRCSPCKVFSYNGKNFVAVERELKVAFQKHANSLRDYGAQ